MIIGSCFDLASAMTPSSLQAGYGDMGHFTTSGADSTTGSLSAADIPLNPGNPNSMSDQEIRRFCDMIGMCFQEVKP